MYELDASFKKLEQTIRHGEQETRHEETSKNSTTEHVDKESMLALVPELCNRVTIPRVMKLTLPKRQRSGGVYTTSDVQALSRYLQEECKQQSTRIKNRCSSLSSNTIE